MSTDVAEQAPEEMYAVFGEHFEALEAEFAPDIANTLGVLAVHGDLIRAVVLVHAEPWLEYELPPANEGVQELLQATRERLEKVDPQELFSLGGKVISSKVPQFLLETLGVEYDHQIFERLVEKESDGSPAVSDEALLNFLQWHNHSMIAKRERFMEQNWPLLRDSYEYDLKQAVKKGWLPEVVVSPERLEALEQVEVTVDDGMRLHEEKVGAFMHTNDTNLATSVYFPQFTFMKTSRHELSHVMVGVKLNKGKNVGRFGNGNASHGLYRLFGEENTLAGKVLDEAFTEHLAQALGGYYEGLDLISPDLRKEFAGSYILERELLHVLCHGGTKPVDIKLFARAYFEDSTDLRKPALRQLKRQLKKAFPGRNVLGELSELMSDGESRDSAEGLIKLTTSLLFNKYRVARF